MPQLTQTNRIDFDFSQKILIFSPFLLIQTNSDEVTERVIDMQEPLNGNCVLNLLRIHGIEDFATFSQ